MTSKELHKLKRAELLEILIMVSRQNDDLKEENDKLKKQMFARELLIEQSGSIAEASLQLSGIFGVAQDAADCYLENTKRMCDEAQRKAREMLESTQSECEEMRRGALHKKQGGA